MAATDELIDALAVTAELLGTALSGAARRLMLADLEAYPERAVLMALGKCRRELKGRLSLSEIISRIEDGRPGVEEAWAAMPRDEATTVVWTDEMRAAWSVALPLLRAGEDIPARMAFKERYLALVTNARTAGIQVKWSVSLGQSTDGREQALLAAVEAGRLEARQAAALLPYHKASGEFVRLLESAGATNLLEAPK